MVQAKDKNVKNTLKKQKGIKRWRNEAGLPGQKKFKGQMATLEWGDMNNQWAERIYGKCLFVCLLLLLFGLKQNNLAIQFQTKPKFC